MKRIFLLVAVLALLVAALGTSPVLAQGPVQGGRGAVAPAPKIGSGQLTQVGPTAVTRGDWVAAGTGMRNRGFGSITISGMLGPWVVQYAFLYWDVLAPSVQPSYSQGFFNGQAVNGALVGMDGDPCWLNPAGFNLVYRANVTKLVSGNGTYTLTGFASGNTDGSDPFITGSTVPMVDGASLIVFYTNTSLLEPKQIQLYDGSRLLKGSGSNSYTLTLSNFTAPPTVHKAKTTFIMGDGQSQFTSTTYSVTFNGTLLPITFKGADPQSGPPFSSGNLWDTVTQDVTANVAPNSTSATVSVTTNECLVWMAQAFEVR